MIDLVTGYARGYSAKQVRPFLMSLQETGYEGTTLMIADGGAAEECRRLGAGVIPCGPRRIKVHSDRVLRWEEELKDIPCEGILLADSRDVIFQKDPSIYLPAEGLNVFLEDARMTLGSCPYNSEWIRIGYGVEVLSGIADHSISCVGTSCGDRSSVLHYLSLLRTEVESIQPKTTKPQDQAAHNYLIRQVYSARVWPNEEGEVYTVGYCRRGSVGIQGEKIVNRSGHVPTVVHQWDRHQNLSNLVEGKWN